MENKMKKLKMMTFKAVLLCSLMVPGIAPAQYVSFSSTAPTGQTLYYIGVSNTASGNYAAVIYPNRNEDYYVWEGYTQPTGALTIPSTVTYNNETYNVTQVWDRCFQTCGDLNSVTIPSTVTYISSTAFDGCGVTSLTLQTDSIPMVSNGSTEVSTLINNSLDTVFVPCNAVGRYLQDGRFSSRRHHGWVDDSSPVVVTSHTTCTQDPYDFAVTVNCPADGSVTVSRGCGTDSVYAVRVQYDIAASEGYYIDTVFVDGQSQYSYTHCENAVVTLDPVASDHTIDIITKPYRSIKVVNHGGGAMIVGRTVVWDSIVVNDVVLGVGAPEIELGTWGTGEINTYENGAWDPMFGYEIVIDSLARQLNRVTIDGIEVDLNTLNPRRTEYAHRILYTLRGPADSSDHSIDVYFGPMTDTATCNDLQLELVTQQIGGSVAIVSWNDPSESAEPAVYFVEFTQNRIDSVTPDWDADRWFRIVHGDTSCYLSGLSFNSTYYVRVKKSCSLLGESNWSNHISFTTQAADTTDIIIVSEGAPVYVYSYNRSTYEYIIEPVLTDSMHVVDTTGALVVVDFDRKEDTIVTVFLNDEEIELEPYHIVYDNWDYYAIGFFGDRGTVRVVFEPMANTANIIVMPSDATLGTVMGGGTYTVGTNAVLYALPQNGTGFMGWNDGVVDNPRTITVTTDSTVVAMFDAIGHDSIIIIDTAFIYVHDTTYIDIHDTTIAHDTLWLTQYDTVWLHDTIIVHDTVYITEEGIDGTEALIAKVYSSQGQIVVEGAEGNSVTLYDVAGRVLATKHDDYSQMRLDVPASGTYMIKIGAYPARKVVVVR